LLNLPTLSLLIAVHVFCSDTPSEIVVRKSRRSFVQQAGDGISDRLSVTINKYSDMGIDETFERALDLSPWPAEELNGEQARA
jgi:hypothetical protein